MNQTPKTQLKTKIVNKKTGNGFVSQPNPSASNLPVVQTDVPIQTQSNYPQSAPQIPLRTLKDFINSSSNMLAALGVFVGLSVYMLNISDKVLGLIIFSGSTLIACLITREIWDELPEKGLSSWRLIHFKRIMVLTFFVILPWCHLRYHNWLRDFLWVEVSVAALSLLLARDARVQKWVRPDGLKINKFRFATYFIFWVGLITGTPYLVARILDLLSPVEDYVRYIGVGLASALALYCFCILMFLFIGEPPRKDNSSPNSEV